MGVNESRSNNCLVIVDFLIPFLPRDRSNFRYDSALKGNISWVSGSTNNSSWHIINLAGVGEVERFCPILPVPIRVRIYEDLEG